MQIIAVIFPFQACRRRAAFRQSDDHCHRGCVGDRTAHGLLTWALATVVIAVLLTSTIASIVSGTTATASKALSGAAQGAVQSANMSDPTAYFVDLLFRTDNPPAVGSPQDVRAESSRILIRSLGEGGLAPEDKTRLAHLVAAQTGLSQVDAERRVDDVVAQVRAVHKVCSMLPAFVFEARPVVPSWTPSAWNWKPSPSRRTQTQVNGEWDYAFTNNDGRDGALRCPRPHFPVFGGRFWKIPLA